jgi:hypothetical protein
VLSVLGGEKRITTLARFAEMYLSGAKEKFPNAPKEAHRAEGLLFYFNACKRLFQFVLSFGHLALYHFQRHK